MKILEVIGNVPLIGSVSIGGAKNSAVALIPASLLTNKKTTLTNVPDITDIDVLCEILEYMNVKVTRASGSLVIDPENMENKIIPDELSSKLRASYYFMACLLAKYKHVCIHFPGGCNIGSRPIDQTLKVFTSLGARVKEEEFFKNSVEKYVIPEYCCNLNYLPDKLKEVIPVSDTRNRPDQKEYEIGSTEKSQEIKAVLEEMQVYKQDILDKNKKEHIPIYFSNEYNEDSKDFVFTYKGGYWEDRKKKKFSKLKDVFDTSEFLKSKENGKDVQDSKDNKDKK